MYHIWYIFVYGGLVHKCVKYNQYFFMDLDPYLGTQTRWQTFAIDG